MAHQQNLLDQKKLCCSICLDLLKDPVTIPCGHSYCMGCIKSYWDGEAICICPQCRQTFRSKPDLVKTTMLADLVEDLKKTGLQAAPADHCDAGPEDVACDSCTGRKLKALKSCLQCLVSYCKQHLQPHYESPAFKRHKLVNPMKKLQENICSRHGKMTKIFCRTDEQCICCLCIMEEHKGHDAVLASEERIKRQRELGTSRQKIQQSIRDRGKDVKMLQEKVESINRTADRTVRNSENIFSQLVCFIKNISTDVNYQIRSRQKTEVSRTKELQENLQQEIVKLRKKDKELEQLSQTEDHSLFLHNYSSSGESVNSQPCESVNSLPCEFTDSPSIKIRPLKYFEDVTTAVSDLSDELQGILGEVWAKISAIVTKGDILQPQEEPKTRAEFLQHTHQGTLDPNTANTKLLLSDENTKATVAKQKQLYSGHQDRFTEMFQVLSCESMSGCCYWEVERGSYEVSVAVAYKDIRRTGYESGFGNDNSSWALECFNNHYEFRHNSTTTHISGPQSSRIGVYLDYKAGTLSFYSTTDSMTLLHRVQTTFTQPLYQGLGIFGSDEDKSTAVLCKLD